MSIHNHTIKRMETTLVKMIRTMDDIHDSIDQYGYESLDNIDKKIYAKTTKQIRKLNHKINHLVNDYYMV